MTRSLAVTAALLGFAAVALGAFGAHGLEGKLTVTAQDWWHTGTFYLLVHAVAAFAVGLSGEKGLIALGGWGLAIGGAIFGATLYALALGAPTVMGMITPIGGVAMLGGWALLAIGALRRQP